MCRSWKGKNVQQPLSLPLVRNLTVTSWPCDEFTVFLEYYVWKCKLIHKFEISKIHILVQFNHSLCFQFPIYLARLWHCRQTLNTQKKLWTTYSSSIHQKIVPEVEKLPVERETFKWTVKISKKFDCHSISSTVNGLTDLTLVAKIIASPGQNTVIHSLFTVCEQNWTIYLFFSLSFALFICLVWKFLFWFSAIV